MEEAAKALSIKAEEVLVCSTGVIGQQLPLEVILKGCNMLPDALSSDLEGGETAAEAILTTDTCKKQVAVTLELGGKTVTIGAMCKGSGMIHPNMGTMLGFITTDAAISKELLQKALSDIVEDTFNMVSVDGDTSTNDTVLVLANGMAGNELIAEENEDYTEFKDKTSDLWDDFKDSAKSGYESTKEVAGEGWSKIKGWYENKTGK
jgi:glutamate N-acetyltransferase/amino-acid N-acetyltransferase